jgi:hypothetical protein
MRFLRLSAALGLFLCLQARAGETIRVLVQSSPLAGSQYYAVSELWSQIKPGDRLTLVREADNRHDRRRSASNGTGTSSVTCRAPRTVP